MHRPFIVAVIVLSLVAASGGPAPAAGQGTEPGLLTNVPRAQFVPNVELGELQRDPAPDVAPSAKTTDGDASDWDEQAPSTNLGGTTVLQSGQLVYHDWIMDATGAARTCVVERRERNGPIEGLLGWSKYQALDSAAGEELIPVADVAGVFDQPQTECEKGVEEYGDAREPAGTTEGAADLLELRVAVSPSRVHLLARFNAMAPSDTPVLAVGIDADADDLTGAGEWGYSSGVATPGADHVLTVTRDAIRVDGAELPGAQVASDDLGQGSPDDPDGFGGVIEASVPLSALRILDITGTPIPTWRLWAGTGIWDADAATWAEPRSREPGPRVMNLAFRTGREPLRPWMEEAQAFALRRAYNAATDGVARLGTTFTETVDLTALGLGAHETWEPKTGRLYVRHMLSRVTDGQRNGTPHPQPETSSVSARQPYSLYIPKGYTPGVPTAATLWLHWRGPGDHQAAYYVPNLFHQLGGERRNVIVAPRGRGSSGWYVGDSQIDVLDALADAEGLLTLDPERLYVAGYSMGGWGAYLLSTMYPDRFAGAFSVVGPPSIGLWAWPAEPVAPQNGRPQYFTNPIVANARWVPTVIFAGTNDELVPVSGVTRHATTYDENQQPYRYHLFAGYEHFTFAVADEWSRAQEYLGNRRRIRDPARVTYARMPCLDPVHWSELYDESPRGAYWVSDMTLADAPSSDECISQGTPHSRLWTTGSVDFAVLERSTNADTSAATVSAGGPPDHTGAYATTGYEKDMRQGVGAPTFRATFTNLSSVRIDAKRARLPAEPEVFGIVTTDTTIAIHLDGIVGGRWQLDGIDQGPFTGTLTVPPGNHSVSLIDKK